MAHKIVNVCKHFLEWAVRTHYLLPTVIATVKQLSNCLQTRIG